MFTDRWMVNERPLAKTGETLTTDNVVCVFFLPFGTTRSHLIAEMARLRTTSASVLLGGILL